MFHRLASVLFVVSTAGCTNTFHLLLENDSNGQFEITSARAWFESTGCTGGNVLPGPIPTGQSAFVEDLPLPDELVGMCIDTTAGPSGATTVSNPGWNVDPGCTLRLSVVWTSYTQSADAGGGPTDCPDIITFEDVWF